MTKEDIKTYANILTVVAILLIFFRLGSADNTTLEFIHACIWGFGLGMHCKSRDQSIYWGLLGFLFGALGYISLFFLKDKTISE